MYDKTKILEEINKIYHQHLDEAKEVVEHSQELMTADDMKQEGKYDTRRIEAGYLTAAQRRRYEEIRIDVEALEHLEILPKEDKVIVTSLVKTKHNEGEEFIFLTPTSGGFHIVIDGTDIHIVSTTSPLGQELLAMEEGDVVDFISPKGEVEYEIIEIY
jgi:transcription elongation GreA/GreB family factor